jgi:hypothetical protein
MRKSSILLLWILVFLCASYISANEIVFFRNSRIVEAKSYEVKGKFIFITFPTGKTFKFPLSYIDMETTQLVAKEPALLKLGSYELSEKPQEAEGGSRLDSKILTNLNIGRYKGKRTGFHKGLEIAVFGFRGWTDTGLDVDQWMQVKISASGEIHLTPSGPACPPDGLLTAEKEIRLVIPNAALGQLIGKIGKNGEPFIVGATTTINPTGSGRLYLGPNELEIGDNWGFLNVVVNPIRTARAEDESFGRQSGEGSSAGARGTDEELPATAAPPTIREDFKRVRPGY